MVGRWYMGCLLERDSSPGYRLPWSAYTGETFLYADTLAGLKELVRRAKQK
jgi:hypothetical protein